MRPMACVECGREAPHLIRGSCPDCFTAKTPILQVPEVLDVELCAHCDARHVGAHWVDPEEEDPLDFIRETAVRAATKVHAAVQGSVIEVEEVPQDEKHFEERLSLTGAIEGAPVTATARTLVRLRRSVCDRCSRMFGGFYAAVIQLRADGRDVSRDELERAHRLIGSELDRLRASGNREAFLTKSGSVPGGFDYYLGDIEGTRAVARVLNQKLGATLQETAKLVGRKEGMDIYRVTFLVRIQLYAPGDFALLDGEELVQVATMDRGKCICYRLSDHRRDRVDVTALRRLGGADALERAVVVSRDRATLQVLDPVTYATHDVAIPEGWEPEAGPETWVLRHEGRIYLPRVAPPPPAPKVPKRRRARSKADAGGKAPAGDAPGKAG